MKTLYPATSSMKIAVTNDDGSQTGEVTYDFGLNQTPPSEEDISKAFESATKELPEGFRPMTRNEFWLTKIAEKMGQRVNFSLPNLKGDERWHDEKTANTYCNWFNDQDEEGM